MEDLKVKATIVAGVETRQAEQDLKKFTDDVDGFKKRLSSKEGIKLSTNLGTLRLQLKDLRADLKQATTKQQKIQIQSNIEIVKKQVTQANRELNNFARTGDKTQSVLGRLFQSVKAGFKDIATGIGVFTLIDRAVQTLFGSIQQGLNNALQLEGLNASLDRLSAKVNETSDNILNSLRTASKGTVSDIELIKSANKALALGVGENADDISTLLEIARLKSKAFGTSTTEAFSDIVTGLGRSSPLILDNLGITIKLGEANEIYAKSIGKTVSELTGLEKKQALINAVVNQGKQELEEAGDVALSTAERREVYKNKVSNALTIVGQYIIYFLLKLEGFGKLSGVVFDALALRITQALISGEIAINKFVSFLSGSVNVFKALGRNIGVAFSNGFVGILQLGFNSAIKAQEKLINSLIDGVNKLGGSLDRVSLGSVDFGKKFEFESISTAFSSAFEGGANEGLRNTRKNIDTLLDKSRSDFFSIKDDIGSIRLGGSATDLSGITSRGSSFGDTGSKPSGGGSGKREVEKEIKDFKQLDDYLIKSRSDRRKKFIKDQTALAKDYVNDFTGAIKAGEKSVDDLTNKIKSANDEIASLSQAQLSEQEKLASKYVELQEKLANPQEGDNIQKIRDDLELINQYTTEAQRAEAERQNTLSDTQKIVEEIQALEEQKISKQEEVAELEKQKELESVILEQFNNYRDELEKQYSKLVEQQSGIRLNILSREIEKTKQLIKLQQQAGVSGFTAPSQASNSNSTTNNSSNNNFEIKIDGSSNPQAVVNELKRQIENFNIGNNL